MGHLRSCAQNHNHALVDRPRSARQDSSNPLSAYLPVQTSTAPVATSTASDDSLAQPTTPPTAAAAAPTPDPNAVASFDLSPKIRQLLADKGITSLFDVQAACVPHALAGKDIVGRARTGCGKTYAFVLPIVSILMSEGRAARSPAGPNVICLLPTRELAKAGARCACL